jgi:hypothetical protein
MVPGPHDRGCGPAIPVLRYPARGIGLQPYGPYILAVASR